MRRLLAAAALVVLAACGSEGSAGPEATGGTTPSATTAAPDEQPSAPERAVETLMRSLDDGDCAAVQAIVVTPATVDCDVVRQAEGSFADEGIVLDDVIYAGGPVEDSSSTVTITWGNEYPDESYDVEKVDGTWRVVFDSVA